MTFDYMMTRAKERAYSDFTGIIISRLVWLLACIFFLIALLFSFYFENVNAMEKFIVYLLSGMCGLLAFILRNTLHSRVHPPHNDAEIFLWYWRTECDRLFKRKHKALEDLLRNERSAIDLCAHDVDDLIAQQARINDLTPSSAKTAIFNESIALVQKAEQGKQRLRDHAEHTAASLRQWILDCKQWQDLLTTQMPHITLIVEARNIDTTPLKELVFAELTPFITVWKNETNYKEPAPATHHSPVGNCAS